MDIFNVQSTGALTIKPNTCGTSIGLGGGAGTLKLDDGELARLEDGFSSITIGDLAAGTGSVQIDTATFLDPVTIAGGTINDKSGTDITAPSATFKGNVSPGLSAGILSVSGDFAFADGDDFTVEIGGTSPGTVSNNHDQIDVVGTVTIGSGVTLNTVRSSGFALIQGNTFTIIDNVPPTISLSGNATVNEGSPYTLNLGVITDPGQETITGYKIEWGDGDIDTFTGNPANTTATHTYADGPATQTHDVKVTDEDGTFLAGSLEVDVLNVAPTVVLSGPTTANEGETKSYSFTATDPGDDTFTLVSQSCGASGVLSNDSFNAVTGEGSFDCGYPDGPALSDVTVQVKDSDDELGNIALVSVAVANLAPTTPVDNDAAPNEVTENAATDTLVGVTVDSSDPGVLDIVTFSLTDDADGRFQIDPDTGVVTVLDGSLLDYEDATSHDITVQASDGQGGTSSQTFTINLLNVNEAPSITSDGGEAAASTSSASRSNRPAAE